MESDMNIDTQYEAKVSGFLKKAVAGLICAAWDPITALWSLSSSVDIISLSSSWCTFRFHIRTRHRHLRTVHMKPCLRRISSILSHLPALQ